MCTSPDTLRLIDAAEAIIGSNNQADMARLLHITDQTLTNWKTRGVPAGELLRVAEILKVNPYWIRDGDPVPRRIIYTQEMEKLFEVAEKLPPTLLQALTRQGDLFAELASEKETRKRNGWQ